jgi:hypothetical protein
MRHLNNLPVKGLCGSCLSVGGSEPHTPLTHCNRVYKYTYSQREGGKGGRVIPERRLQGPEFKKLGRKYQQTDCVSSL